MEELPGKLKLQAQSIKISLNKPRRQRFSVRFRYGNEDHTTSPTTKALAGDEHTWFAFYPPPAPLLSLIRGQERSGNLVDRNQGSAPRAIGFLGGSPSEEGCIQESEGLCNREFLREFQTTPQSQAYLTTHVQLLNNVNRQVLVKLEAPRSNGPAVLRIFLVEAL